ncbi:MAG: hypothetical protein H0T99_05540, partial [Geodermatophilaceae bacterium]|nr:hypothetical protein [Geodermatophilaceae bacterium]
MSEPLDLSTAWDRVLTSLERSDVAPHQMALLGLTRPLGLVEDTVLIAAPNEFTQKFLESRLRPRLTEQLCVELGREIRIAVTVEAVPDASSPDLLDGAQVADYEFDDDDPSIPVVAHVQRATEQRPTERDPDGQRPASPESAGADPHNVRSLTDHSRRT